MRRTAAETREHVLGVVQDLFYWQGIHAVGVDRIAAEAGVAPTTLYRAFGSKDDLVAAYVERTDEVMRGWFSSAIREDGRSADERTVAVFESLVDTVQPSVFRGCACLMTLAEFPDAGSAAHLRAVEAKVWVREQFGRLVADLAVTTPIDDPDVLADQLALVYDGVLASAMALGADGPASSAIALVRTVLSAVAPLAPLGRFTS